MPYTDRQLVEIVKSILGITDTATTTAAAATEAKEMEQRGCKES